MNENEVKTKCIDHDPCICEDCEYYYGDACECYRDRINMNKYLSQEEFANSKYECLTYYYDGHRLYDFDGKTEVDSSFLGGLDIDELFINSEYENIYIRNDLLKCDYEIGWKDTWPDQLFEGSRWFLKEKEKANE